MFELTIEREFCAAHALLIQGEREPLHGHNWTVRVTVRGAELDEDGLLCDFHLLERKLDKVLQAFHNRNLNEVAPFDRLNPTAELVCGHIAESMRADLPEGVEMVRCSVTEAPGCRATYVP